MSQEDRIDRLRELRIQVCSSAEDIMVEFLPAEGGTQIQVVDTYLEASLGVVQYLTKLKKRIAKSAGRVAKLLDEDDE